jgi:DNA-directed RNA polymerase specialized sigma24 family protein
MSDQKYARVEEPPTATLGSTSQSLLDRLRLGGDEDQRLLITLYWSLVLNLYIDKRVVEDLEDRMDITSRVFRTVFRRIESQGFVRLGRGAFRGWLRITTRNKVGDFIRRDRRRKAKGKGPAKTLVLPPANNVDGENGGGTDENTERALLVRQAIEVVRAEFEPASYEMARLQLMEGVSAAAAGATRGRSANAAYIAKCRVKRRLHEILERFEIWDTGQGPSLVFREPDHE